MARATKTAPKTASEQRAAVARLLRDADPVELGQRIADMRMAAGLTQKELAEPLITAAHMSRIEAGHRRPTLDLIERIAEMIDVPPLRLLEATSPYGQFSETEVRDRVRAAERVARAVTEWMDQPGDPKTYTLLTRAVEAWRAVADVR